MLHTHWLLCSHVAVSWRECFQSFSCKRSLLELQLHPVTSVFHANADLGKTNVKGNKAPPILLQEQTQRLHPLRQSKEMKTEWINFILMKNTKKTLILKGMFSLNILSKDVFFQEGQQSKDCHQVHNLL